jgi:hypothetical protein
MALQISASGCLPTSSDDKGDLGLSLDEDVSIGLGLSLGVDEGLVSSGVLLGVLLGVGGSSSSLGSTVLLVGLALSLESGLKFGISGLLLLDVLWDNSCPKTNTMRVS